MKRGIIPTALLAVVLLVWLVGPRLLRGLGESQVREGPSVVVRPEKSTEAKSESPPAVEQLQARQLEFFRGMAELSNRPIDFYGVVIDQNDQPIAGVKVTIAIRVAKEPAPGVVGDGFDYPVIVTDDQGRFSITGAKGALLAVQKLEKHGYEAGRKGINRGYWYWRSSEMVFVPNSEKPEVFRMWKKLGAERLVTNRLGGKLRPDGTPIDFDLLTGGKIDADLRVSLSRVPQQIVYGQRNYEWTLTVEAINGGGVIESDAEQMYFAPESGYQDKYVIHVAANDPAWTDQKSVSFYAKLRNGAHYARVEMKAIVGSDRETTPFYLNSYVNPSGGRNLEYDPKLPPAIIPAKKIDR